MYLFLKRLFDILTSLVLLVIVFPVMLISAIAIKLDSRGPIIFSQKRYGKNKKIFTIYKFRTMRLDAPSDVPTHLLENPKKWATRVGWFLRKTNIDELPQLINIMIGQMSFVGPRPALWNQNDLIFERDKYGANSVPVGLTGYAQLHSLDEMPIAQKASLDGKYASIASILCDTKIMLLTFAFIFKRASRYRKTKIH